MYHRVNHDLHIANVRHSQSIRTLSASILIPYKTSRNFHAPIRSLFEQDLTHRLKKVEDTGIPIMENNKDTKSLQKGAGFIQLKKYSVIEYAEKMKGQSSHIKHRQARLTN